MKHSFKFNITASLKKAVVFCGLIAMTIPFTACSDDDDEPVNQKPNITVIIGTLGKGDNDYCTLVYNAIEKWKQNPEVDMVVHYPKTVEEATVLYREWAEKTANGGRSLMIPANGEYIQMITSENLNLKDNQQVLSFEMKLKNPMKGVYTFQTDHSGVAYLAGTLAALCGEANVLYGLKNALLTNAGKYFNDGYKKYAAKDCKEVELSKGFDGFNMPEEAYEFMKGHANEFILPLAGLSNNGVYKYLQECDKNDSNNAIMACGVDVDCNALSKRIPFSYMINIDKAIDAHIQAWVDGQPWPTAILGLKNGFTEIRINPAFTQIGKVTKADLEKRYKENFEEAATMDK